MFKKTALIAGIGLALSANAQADYRWQVDGQVGRTNIDVGPVDGDVDHLSVGGRFYFDEVDTGKGPLGEAAFLDQASSVGATYNYVDADDIVEDLDGDEYGLDIRYVLPLDSIPLILEAEWMRQTPDISDIDHIRLGIGAYVTEATSIVLSYRTVDVDESDDIDAGDIDAYELDIEHLWELGDNGALKLRGHYGMVDVDDGDDIDAWSIGSTWYFTEAIGVGFDYGRFDNFGVEEDTYSLSGEWFVSETIGLSASYTYSEIDDTDIEIESFVLGGEFRF